MLGNSKIQEMILDTKGTICENLRKIDSREGGQNMVRLFWKIFFWVKKPVFWSKIVIFYFCLIAISFQIFDDNNFEPLLVRICQQKFFKKFSKIYQKSKFQKIFKFFISWPISFNNGSKFLSSKNWNDTAIVQK